MTSEVILSYLHTQHNEDKNEVVLQNEKRFTYYFVYLTFNVGGLEPAHQCFLL